MCVPLKIRGEIRRVVGVGIFISRSKGFKATQPVYVRKKKKTYLEQEEEKYNKHMEVFALRSQ